MEKNGGRPSKKTTGFEKEKTTGFENKKPNENVNVNVNENVNENNNENDLCNDDVAKIDSLMIECLNTTNTNNILECTSYLEKMPIEVIEYALKKTARISQPNWKYAMSILDSYVQKNIDTLEKAKADDLNFKSKNLVTAETKKEETLEEQVARYKKEWGLTDED